MDVETLALAKKNAKKQIQKAMEGGGAIAGKSAYEIAVENGFVGSESQWLASLEGSDGESAYQIALDNGFEGTEQQWLASLHGQNGTNGTDGESAYEIAVDNGFEGTEEEWLASLHGADGQDADTSDIEAEIGDLTQLDTTIKTDLVSAINEVAGSGGGGSSVEEATQAEINAIINGMYA